MAEEKDDSEKTEDPSQRRLDQALEHGDVVKSQEVNTWFVFAAAALVLLSFSGSLAGQLTATFRNLLANAHAVGADAGALQSFGQRIGIEVLAAVSLPLLLFVLAGLAGNLIQHRLVWSFKSLTPKLSKISPGAGLKRLFSRQALANFVKGLIKLAVVGAVLCALLWPERWRLENLVAMEPAATIPVMRSLSLQLLGAVVALMAVIAAADYLFQYRLWFKRQKMSLHEVKQEFKESEGDPTIKGKLRQLRQARSRKRMMAAVPTATVVIANPTHFAVALKYERGMNAPLCVAKGVDALALRIRAMAEEHRVAVVGNPPLARALHAAVDVDEEVPAEHYKAVAEVIGYVMRVRQAAMAR